MEEIRQFLDQVIAHSSPEAPIWNQEARLANHPIRWSYIDGCMILAIQYMFNATQDENYLAFVGNLYWITTLMRQGIHWGTMKRI